MGIPFDVTGPIQAEVFTLALANGELNLTGPCGAVPWVIEVDDREHPFGSVRRIVEGVLDDVWLVHSTSWRWDTGTVTLTFVVVIDPESIGAMETAPVARTTLARSEASAPPPAIGFGQVLEHGIRHIAWLAEDDDAVAEVLTPAWRGLLAGYVPEPFRQLDTGGDR